MEGRRDNVWKQEREEKGRSGDKGRKLRNIGKKKCEGMERREENVRKEGRKGKTRGRKEKEEKWRNEWKARMT